MLHNLAVRLATLITNELKMDGRRGIVAYGLEILLGALVNLIFFVTLPLALGIFPQVVAAALAGGIFRLASGGAHCTAYYRCLVSSSGTFLGLGALARYLSGYSLPTGAIVAGVAIWSLLIVLRRAPADNPARPITNAAHRRALRIASVALVAVYAVTGLCAPLSNDLILAASGGLFLQVFTITPAGYRFIEMMDRLLSGQIIPCRD